MSGPAAETGPGARWTGALDDGTGLLLRGRALATAVDEVGRELAAHLEPLHGRTTQGAAVGLLADNGAPWVLADLAALELGVTLVPLPGFFTDAQLVHAATSSGLCAVIADEAGLRRALSALGAAGGTTSELPRGLAFAPLRAPGSIAERRAGGAAKITFTSGTTGAPKGVHLAAQTLIAVAHSLAQVTGIGEEDVHVTLLPLSVLLENVGGVYRALLAGARVLVPAPGRLGLSGSSAQSAESLVDCLESSGATTAILVPQTLALLVDALEHGRRLPRMRLLGVGGAPVARPLLARAERLGLPVFEGYGLSEAGSVLTLNTPAAHRPGTVGRPLPHVTLRIADDGEILARGPALIGYVGGDATPLRDDGWLATGDLGALDDDGFLVLTGRKRSVLRTAWGRKLSPEWVERELLADPRVAAAAVFGDGLPQPWAVLVPASPGAALEPAVAAANARLPDYARVSRWIAASAPFAPGNGQLSAAGRLRRDAIEAAYAPLLAPTTSSPSFLLPAATR